MAEEGKQDREPKLDTVAYATEVTKEAIAKGELTQIMEVASETRQGMKELINREANKIAENAQREQTKKEDQEWQRQEAIEMAEKEQTQVEKEEERDER